MAKLKEKAFWIAVGDISGRGFSFAASIYLARILGAELFGLIILAISILGYATWFSDLGLINIGTRESAKNPQKRTYRLVEIFSLKMILGIVVLIVSTFVISQLNFSNTEKLVIFGYLYSIIPYMAMMEWYFSGTQEFGKIAASKSINGLAYFVLVMLLVNSTDDVILVPVLYTTGVALASLLLGTFAFRSKAFSLPSRGLNVYPDLLKTSSILGVGQFFAQIVQLLPPLLIGTLLSLQEAGLYGAAFRVVLIAMMIDRVFVNLLLPNLASLWSKDPKSTKKIVDIVYRAIAIGGAMTAMIVAISAEQIIGILYGTEYVESIHLLQILSVMIGFTFINSLFSFGLIATGKDREYFSATCVGGSISAAVIILFAVLESAVMVTVAVSISEIIITISTLIWFQKVIPLNYIKPVLISFSLAISLFIVFYFIPFAPLINAVLATIIYVTIILMSGLLNSSQRNWLKQKLI